MSLGCLFNTHFLNTVAMNLTSSQLTKLAIALGGCFAVYKFVDKPEVRTMAIGVAGVIIGRQLPYIKDAL